MADDLIREIPRIRRYARHNEAEDARFAGFLKLRLDLSNAELDAIVRETTDDVWSKIDCLTCGNCCRTLQIVVDEKDVRRLARRLGITEKEFARKYVAVAEDRTKYFQATPCPFLGEGNACSVYEDRPQACRDFPYLHEDRFRHRTITMVENCETCPIVFNVWQALKKRFPRFRR
ncbi:MAG: YkgJ family cysteine cluster protein [Capsulimonadales bacterium]|nr:YkgJ family cysteine cluster protein [Capsulimonadales bacterium]